MKVPRCGSRRAVVTAAVALALVVACSTGHQDNCTAPSSGSFAVALTFAQTVPAAIYCDGAAGDAGSCENQAHPFDDATLVITVEGAEATVASSDGGAPSWPCHAMAPDSAPSDGPDGGTPGTACYLLVSCAQVFAGTAGVVDLQIQLFTQASSDVLVIAHQTDGFCCTDEYTGAWQ
jgi:hypothetical protein